MTLCRQFRQMAIGERIARARVDAGWSQSKLAGEVGQAQTTISSWERGRTEPTREDVQRIAAALRIDAASLEVGETDTTAPDVRMVRVVGYVGAGDAAHFYDTAQGPFDEVPAPQNATKDTVAAEVRGPSIGRNFDGWLVFYDEVRNPVTEDQHGELCVVGLPDGRVLVKWLKAAKSPGVFHLISETEGPMNDEEVSWAARVTSMRPR